MESYGEKLREARISKGYTLEQVAQETHISKVYLQALEEEDSTAFPAETYLIGFLRNYAEYLELNSNEIATLYKNIKIQEQPIPMHELLHGTKSTPVAMIAIIVVLSLGLITGGGFFITWLINRNTVTDSVTTTEQTITETIITGDEYIFNGEFLNQSLNLGDIVKVLHNDELYRIKITQINDMAILKVPTGTIQLEKEKPLSLDLDNDEKLDIELYLIDINNLNNTIDLKLSKINTLLALADSASPIEEIDTPDEISPEPETIETEPEITQSDVIITPIPTNADDRIVIIRKENPQAFNIQINFTGNCMLRHFQDQKNRIEQYYFKNDSLDIENSQSSVKLWVMNAGAVNTTIAGKQIKIGSQGQAVTKLIQWIKDEDSNNYLLVMDSNY